MSFFLCCPSLWPNWCCVLKHCILSTLWIVVWRATCNKLVKVVHAINANRKQMNFTSIASLWFDLILYFHFYFGKLVYQLNWMIALFIPTNSSSLKIIKAPLYSTFSFVVNKYMLLSSLLKSPNHPLTSTLHVRQRFVSTCWICTCYLTSAPTDKSEHVRFEVSTAVTMRTPFFKSDHIYCYAWNSGWLLHPQLYVQFITNNNSKMAMELNWQLEPTEGGDSEVSWSATWW
jgi:hypothetical protein